MMARHHRIATLLASLASFVTVQLTAGQTQPPVAPAKKGATRDATARPAAAKDAKADDDSESPDAAGALMSAEALARFQSLLGQRPLHTQAFAGLVKHYAEQGKLAELVTEYERKAAALPDDGNLKIVLARLYLRAGQPDKAADLVGKVEAQKVSLGRDESKWLLFKAELFQRTGKLSEAEAVLGEAMRLAKSVSERFKLAEGLSDLHLAGNDKTKAAAALTDLAKEFRTNFLYRKRIADALAQRDLHDAAVVQYREILEFTQDKSDDRCETLRQLGRSLERLNKTQDAIDAYSEALNLLAGGHWLQQELHERVVTLYRGAGRMDDLVSYCRAQIDKTPEQTGIRILLADVLSAMGNVDEAKKTLADAIALFPKDRPLSEKRVQFLDRAGDAAAAAAEYERIISQLPDDLELYIAYGQFLANNKQLDAARNQWKHVLGSDLADATLAHRLGSLFEPYDMLDDAVECYERSIKLAPTRSETYAALARLWFYRGEKDKSLDTLRRMTAANDKDAANHAAVCQTAASLGLNDEALASIGRACELAPQNVDYQTVRADLLVLAGKLEEALSVRRLAIDLIRNPVQQAEAVNTLVSMHATAGKLKELKSAEEQRVEKQADQPVSLLMLARIADTERDFPGARKWLEQLLKIDGTHQEALFQLARMQEAAGDIDAAVAAYKRLIDLHPNRARHWYQAIADLRLRYNDKAGAIDTFTQIVQSAPGNATVLKDVAEQLGRLGELDKAIEYYELALRQQGDRHEIRLAYANTLIDAGRLDDAMAAYKAVALQRTDRDSATEAMSKLHAVATRQGVLDELMEDLENRLATEPENSLVANTLAELFIREFEFNRAMDLLDKLLRQRPRDAELELVRAELLRRLTRFDDALDAYRRVLRIPQIDRDFVLGEMGKACFEAGRIDQAKAHWRSISHKLYAGTLLRNNGLLTEAIDVLREGIRLKPDDYNLHRNLIRALHASGRIDDALDAARRLLDLEPDNDLNVRDLAKAYLERNNRAAAAEIAARLFSATVAEKRIPGQGPAPSSSGGPNSVYMASLQSAWSSMGYGSGSQPRNNIEKGIQFFRENGLLAELEEVLTAQLAAQPDNALLKLSASSLFDDFGKPEVSLRLLKELETAAMPLEYQTWLGQSSQRDHYRLRQFQLIASKPALRDARLAELEKKSEDALSRDELLELALIRQSQGSSEKAIELLRKHVAIDADDRVALSTLVSQLHAAERFTDAEPHVLRLIDLVARERDKLSGEMADRVRRDFVRTLPVQLQLRVTDELLREIAHKWTLGQSFAGLYSGFAQTTGYFGAKLILATIYAKTSRMEQARAVWEDLAPKHPADVDGWTMLAGVAQLEDQDDLAMKYYERAMHGARVLAGDQLLQRIYGGSLSQVWYSDSEAIDTTFNKIIETFAKSEKLIELYDFLRDTDQTAKARRVAQQYNLFDRLIERYAKGLDEARAAFKQSPEDPLDKSVPLFMAVCKLAEVQDQKGDWEAAEKTYESYLAEFPDELALLETLGEIAEKQSEFAAALECEKKVVAAKERLARKARAWTARDLPMLPGVPRILGDESERRWDWPQRWGRNYGWWSYGSRRPLEVWPSWIRIAQLYLAVDNLDGAAMSFERAIGAGGTDREDVCRQVLNLIRERRLGDKMQVVLRTVASFLSTDEDAQLAFAESLEAGDRGAAAMEIYRRMLRRGVSNVGTLARVREKLAKSEPDAAALAAPTLAALETEVLANPGDTGNRLRLARAYYYSLDLDRALQQTEEVLKVAPHLEGLHDLLIEIQTLRGDSDRLVAALREKIKRATEQRDRDSARQRLADELLARGETNEALEVLKELVNPQNPSSYERIGVLLHYFGRHDEALQQFELAGRSQQASAWQGDRGELMQVRALVIKGDIAPAADKLLVAVDKQARQSTSYGGMSAIYAYGNSQENYFRSFTPVLVLESRLADEVAQRLEKRLADNPDDPQAAKVLHQFYNTMGRTAQGEALFAKIAGKQSADQTLVDQQVDQAIEKKDYDRAIKLAKDFIAQQTKTTIPPGVPPQFAGQMVVMSPRNMMLCKLGDVYWKKGDKDAAFETYRQILDEKYDESRIAFASICMMRERVDDAKKIVEEALAKQKMKSGSLLQFRAAIHVLEGRPLDMLDDLAGAADAGEGGEEGFMMEEAGVSPQMVLKAALAAEQFDRFVTFMKKRINKNPNNWNEHFALAEAYYNAGRFADAMAVLDKAAKVKSLKPSALRQKIDWSDGYAPVDELIPLFEELISLAEKQTHSGESFNPFRSRGGGGGGNAQDMRDRLGALYWDKGDVEKAVKVWSQRMDPNQAGTHMALAQRYATRHDDARAAEAYRRALQLQPNLLAAHRALIDLEYRAGNQAAALDHLYETFLKEYQPSGAGDDADEGDTWDQDNQPWRAGNEDPVRAVALELAADESIAARLRDAATPEDQNRRLMLSVYSGDWATVETEVARRIASERFDPLLWKLQAHVMERKADWVKAAEAWEQVRRINRTSIPAHRDQLKIVLAGKQVRDAAAGTKDPNAMAAALAAATGGRTMPSVSYSSNYYGRRYYGGRATDAGERLSALYLKLGKFDLAERLQLLSANSSPEYLLPRLAWVMRRQGSRDRAGELYRLALTLSDNTNQIPQYAALLAESGEIDRAADLIVGAYCCQEEESSSRMGYAFYYGGYYPGNNNQSEEFESQQQSTFAAALLDVLTRQGVVDVTLNKLAERFRSDQTNERLARLLVGLQTRACRWQDARATLDAWIARRPYESALSMTAFLVNIQLGDWDAALSAVERLRKNQPDRAGRWDTLEAYVRLMQKDASGALAAIEAHVVADSPSAASPDADHLTAILASSGELPRLRAYLDKRLNEMSASDVDRRLLARLRELDNQWEPAAALSLDKFWRQNAKLEASDDVFRSLANTVRRAAAAGKPVKGAEARPEDSVLALLITDGPAKAADGFRDLIRTQPDNVNARRGLVLALELAGDMPAAAAANDELIQWLHARIHDVWQPAIHPSLERRTKQWLEQMKGSGLNAQMVLNASMSFANVLQQLFEYGSSDEDHEQIRYYDVWRTHQIMQRHYLAAAGQIDKVEALLRAQADHAAIQRNENDDGMSGVYYTSRGGMAARYTTARRYYSGNRQEEFSADWRAALRQTLGRHRLYGPLLDRVSDLKADRGADQGLVLSEALAAMGRADDAAKRRRASAEAKLAALRGVGGPTLDAGNDWSWYWYGNEQDVERFRRAFRVRTRAADPYAKEETKLPITRTPTQVYQLALLDPEIESRLISMSALLKSDSGESQAAWQLLSLYAAKDQFAEMIELLERLYDFEALVRSNRLSMYVWACYETNDLTRLEKLWTAAEARHKGVANEVKLSRLMMLRRGGRDADADALEQSLLAECRPARPAPLRPGDVLAACFDEAPTTWRPGRAFNQAYYNLMRYGARTGVPRWTAEALAASLEIPHAGDQPPYALTAADLREAYSNHGLWTHTVRILDWELDKNRAGLTARELAEALMARADGLERSGARDAARKQAEEVEALWKAQAQADPADAVPPAKLAFVYASRAYGRDYAKAADAVRAAARLDPAYDADHQLESGYLFELGRYEEAWNGYRLRAHGGDDLDTGIMYRAGICAAKAGALDEGRPLLRQALWRDPGHKLADSAREFVK